MKNSWVIILCLVVVAVSVVVFVSCSRRQPENGKPKSNNVTAGGWADAESPVITNDFKKVFDKATKQLERASYTPVAYLKSQVVAGMNHCVLCKSIPSVPNAASTYSIVYIYEKLDGKAEITSVLNSYVNANSSENEGGWANTQSPVLTDNAAKALEKACKKQKGEEYRPVALLATQVVAGFNYRLLCESNGQYIIVTVYADLDGNAEITETAGFKVAE